MTHTPTPWQVNKKVSRMIETVTDGQGVNLLADCADPDGDRTLAQDQANAAFIVRACNSHDALVAALERVIRSGWASIDHERNRTPEACDIREQICAALSLAKGE